MSLFDLMRMNQMMNPQQGFMPQGMMPPPSPMGMPMGGMGQSMPTAQPPMPTMPQPMQEESPIARGLSSGMSAGRQSLEMDEDQRNRALGMVVARMFGGLVSGKSPSTMGRLSEGLSGGLDEFQRERALVAEMNAKEIDRQDRLQRELQRQKERTEMTPYQKEMLSLSKQKLALKQQENAPVNIGGVDFSSLPELDKPSRSKYSVDYNGTGKLLTELKTIKEKVNHLKSLETKGGKPLVSQANPYIGSAANVAKDFLGRALPGESGKQLNEERLARQSLNSRLQSFRVKAERAIKGGVLSQGMVDRFEKMGTFPDLSQGYDTVETLLNDLEKEASEIHNAAGLSLKTGRQVTPNELEMMQSNEDMTSKIEQARQSGFSEEEIRAILEEE